MNARAPDSGTARGVVGRVTRNAFLRAVAELLGKFASLALIAVLARKQGPVGVGVLVFALAWCELSTAPIEMGLDRYFLRRVAVDRRELDRFFYRVLILKLWRALPVLAISWALVLLVEDDAATRISVVVLSVSLLLDSLSWTVYAAFNALERGELIAASMISQRVVAAGAGIALLLAGLGVVAVAIAYAAGSAIALGIALILLARRIGLPGRGSRSGLSGLTRPSLPFAAQELLAVGIARVDAVLLAAIATQAIVGFYGAAYRLLEATLFLSTALQGAFVAMYTYLHERSEPTVGAVYQRSLKLSLALLTPCAVVLTVLAGPTLELLFGRGFEEAVTPLRLLGLTVVPLGLVLLSSSLISSRRDPKLLVAYSGAALILNVGLNIALIPTLEQDGAALAMLVTYVLFSVALVRLSAHSVGGIHLTQTLGAALAAGAAMATVAYLIQEPLWLALAACVPVYCGVFGLVERAIAPADFRFLLGMVGDRLRSRPAATLPKEPQEGA